MALHANYSPLIVAVLAQAWHIFGRFTPENQDEVARWVQQQVNDIKNGYEAKNGPAKDPWKEF